MAMAKAMVTVPEDIMTKAIKKLKKQRKRNR